jgi:hypothetical protein
MSDEHFMKFLAMQKIISVRQVVQNNITNCTHDHNLGLMAVQNLVNSDGAISRAEKLLVAR